MGDRPIRILLVEDSTFATRHAQKMLDEARSAQFDTELKCANRLSVGLERLAQGGIDIVLLDLTLPDSEELDTFAKVHAHAPEVPIVVLSGLEDETLAIDAVQKGAQDYLIKGQVDSNLLKRSILYAIERKRSEEELRKYRDHLEELVEERTHELRKEITQRKKTEEKLASSEEFLNSVIEQSPVSLWISDSEGTLIKMNQSCRELFGVTDEEAVGKYNLFKDNVIQEQGFMPLVENVFEKGEIARFTLDYDLLRVGHVKVNGATHRDLDVIIAPTKDMHGKVINAIVQHKDITERKQAEEKLKASNQQLRANEQQLCVEITQRKQTEENLKKTLTELERSNWELKQFAKVASHDLQEPLRMVASYTQLLEKRYKDKLDSDAKEFIGFAVEGATRMQRLINDLLAYSHVGTRDRPFEVTDCYSVLGQAIANLRPGIEANDAIIANDDLPSVMVDASQMVQLFQNLIGNAIKFRGEQPPRIHVSAQQKGDEWVFSVRDNGIGIGPQYKEKIFIVFQRLHGPEKYLGTGIGLALCKKIVERHGGRIWVDSESGKGSTFYFTIPTRESKEPSRSKTTVEIAQGG